MKTSNLNKVTAAIAADVKAGAKHLPILKNLTFSASIDADEVKAIVAAYEAAYDEYKISSHNIYKNYYGRILITGTQWIKHFITQEGLSKSSCTRDELLNKVLFTAKKLASKKISYYNHVIKDMIKNRPDGVGVIALLEALSQEDKRGLRIDAADYNIIDDIIAQQLEAFKLKAEELKNKVLADADEGVVDDADADEGVVDVDDADDADEGVVEVDVVDDLSDTNKARIDYIIKKLTILNKVQLDRVVSLIDSF